MVTIIQEKSNGMLVEVVEYKLPNCKILNSKNVKFGDLIFLSEDGKNLNTIGDGKYIQIIGNYVNNNTVKLYYNGWVDLEKVFDTEVIKVVSV